MEKGKDRTRGFENVAHTVRVLAQEFGVDEVVIVGSQALLVHRSDVLGRLRDSPEIDAFVLRRDSESADPDGEEASHRINSLFGEGSAFHQTHGYFIDGVDASTATLPPDWRSRAIRRQVAIGEQRSATVVAPSIPDLVASKLARGEPKDVRFAALCMGSGLVKRRSIEQSIATAMNPEQAATAIDLLNLATSRQKAEMTAAQGLTSGLARGPKGSPLDDIDALEAVRRLLSSKER